MTTNKILIVLCFLLSLQLQAQKYYTRSGSTQFEGSEKAFEPIAATNTSTTVILDTRNGNIVSQVFMAGFQFKNALMQEHFNENYMDSYQYPKATFKGNLDGFSMANLKTSTTFDLNGVLAIKGLEKNIQTSVTVRQQDNRMFISGVFFVSPEDFDITIPSIVRDKIAKQIQINIDYELIEKNKLVFIFSVVALLAIGVGYGYQYIFMSPKKVVEITPKLTAGADEFNNLMDENLPSWIGKVVQITGKATQVTQDGILLNGSIYCQFENSQDIQSITKNQNIVIKGKLVGFDELLMETKLNQCIIIQ